MICLVFWANLQQYQTKMPHPFWKLHPGHMVYAVSLIIFMDNVSGNISKQWNMHHAIYMSNANLPHEMLEKEFHVHFVTSSPHALPMELMKAMKDSVWWVFTFNSVYDTILCWPFLFKVNAQSQVSPPRTANIKKILFSVHTVCFGGAIIPCRQRSAAMWVSNAIIFAGLAILVATQSSKSQMKAISLFSMCIHFSQSLEHLNINIHL